MPPHDGFCVFTCRIMACGKAARETTKPDRILAVTVSFVPPRCWDIDRQVALITVDFCCRFVLPIFVFCVEQFGVKQSWIEDDWLMK